MPNDHRSSRSRSDQAFTTAGHSTSDGPARGRPWIRLGLVAWAASLIGPAVGGFVAAVVGLITGGVVLVVAHRRRDVTDVSRSELI